MSDLALEEYIDAEIVEETAIERMPALKRMDLFTQHRQKVIYTAVREGASFKNAARLANVKPHLLNDWLKHGDKYEDSPAALFTKRVYHDKAERELEMMKKMLEVGKGPAMWQAYARLLECANPEDFARPSGNGTQVNVQVNNVSKINAVETDTPMLSG